MNATRRPPGLFAAGTMLLLCVCWGFQQVAIKIVAPDVAPVLQIALRSGCAALVLGWITLHREGPGAFSDATFQPGMVVGILFGLEFLCVAEGLVYTSAAHMAVFLYTAPVFAALGLHVLLPEERLTSWQWLGVVTAFGGIAFALLAHPETRARNALLGDALGLIAGAAWGATTVMIRHSALSEAPPVKTLCYQLFLASVLLLAVALATDKMRVVSSGPALLSLTFQTVVIALFSYLAWFRLLRRYLASRLSILSLMTPLFGVLFGVLILHERLTAAFIGAGILVIGGIAIVSAAELTASPADVSRSGSGRNLIVYAKSKTRSKTTRG